MPKQRNANGTFYKYSQRERETAFWSKVLKLKLNFCWPWQGAKSSNGYGWSNELVNEILPHRITNALIFGPIPKGVNVCHTCDNPICCRPSHTFRGTQKANIQDCHRKGRSKNVFQLGHAPTRITQVTLVQLEKIRVLHKEGLSDRMISEKLGIARHTVNKARNGKIKTLCAN